MVSFWNKLKLLTKPFLILAPLDGVTDFVFREIIAETAKPDVFFTEFTSINALCSEGYDKTIARLKYSEKQRYIVAQIWGTDPQKFYKTAELVKDLGFDGIDINMGCPDRDVMKLGSGASHIKNPRLAAEIIAAVKDAANGLPISVKTRIGINTPVTQSWIQFLLDQNLDAITIHGRTAAELSKAKAHWEEIEKVVNMRDQMSINTVVIGNGDIKSVEETFDVHTKYKVDGVMIGKGVFTNPWIFERIPKKHTTNEYLNLLLKHTKLFCDTYPEKYRFAVMKKFFKIYVKSFYGANNLKIQLMETKSFLEVENLVKLFLPDKESIVR